MDVGTVELTQEEIDTILKVAMKCGCDRDGDILRLFVQHDRGIVQTLRP